MTDSNIKIKYWNQVLKKENINLDFPTTKFLTNKTRINSKILRLLNEEAQSVNQLQSFGWIILDKTILSGHDNLSISEQGIISSDFFKARIIDVNNTINKNIYFHLVKVISGIITINYDHEVTLIADEEFNQQLFNNKLAAKLFNLFLQINCDLPILNNKSLKLIANPQNFQLIFNKPFTFNKTTILKIRDLVNNFLSKKPIKYHNYGFISDSLNKEEMANIGRIEKIELKSFTKNKNITSVIFLVGKEKITNFFSNSKKELISSIKAINQKIKLIDDSNLISEFQSDLTIDCYENLTSSRQYYLKLKKDFNQVHKQNPDLIKKLINDSTAVHYSEKIGDWEFIHINFNNFLIDKTLLEAKVLEKITKTTNKVLFLSNNGLDNAIMIWSISNNLIHQIKMETLINQFKNNLNFKKIIYNNQESVFVEANNYQVINDFISNVINFFKINNNQTISI